MYLFIVIVIYKWLFVTVQSVHESNAKTDAKLKGRFVRSCMLVMSASSNLSTEACRDMAMTSDTNCSSSTLRCVLALDLKICHDQYRSSPGVGISTYLQEENARIVEVAAGCKKI